MTIVFGRRRFLAAALTMLVLSFGRRTPLAQIAASSGSLSHVVIPFLANSTKPMDLDFEGGECELDSTGEKMACTFQQVFLTTSATSPDTCLITTNRYERSFRRDTASRWVSTEGPDGDCGLLDVVTLQDGGGVRWTMETRKVVTMNGASSVCQGFDTQPETLGWQNIRRPLPCRFVQPAALSR